MANEISISTGVTCQNGIDKTPFNPASVQVDQTGADVNSYTFTVTDAGFTAVGKASIGNLGLCILHNLSQTAGDIVYVSFDNGSTEHCEIPPKCWILVWLRSSYDIATLECKAATGKTVAVKVYLYEK